MKEFNVFTALLLLLNTEAFALSLKTDSIHTQKQLIKRIPAGKDALSISLKEDFRGLVDELKVQTRSLVRVAKKLEQK